MAPHSESWICSKTVCGEAQTEVCHCGLFIFIVWSLSVLCTLCSVLSMFVTKLHLNLLFSLVPRSQTKICKNVQILLLSVPAGPGYTSVKIFLMMIVTPLCKFCPNCFMPNFCNIFLVEFSIFCEEDCPAACRWFLFVERRVTVAC